MSSLNRRSTKASAARFGALGLGAVALGCAAMAAFFVGNMLTAKGYTGDRVRPVVVANHNLAAAQPLSPADLTVVDWPEQNVPSGAFERVEDVFLEDERPVPSVGILGGEPVVASRLATIDTGSGIARLVRPNMRAFALKVDDSIGYTGLVYPGAYVDVVVTIRDPLGRGPSSRIGVQRAKVLTVGADTDVATRRTARKTSDRLTNSPDQGGTYVTLEVTPQEAEILSIARNEGKLDIVLRNGNDDLEVETEGATPRTFSAFAPEEEEEVDQAVAQARTRSSRKSSRSRRSRRNRTINVAAKEDPEAPPKRSSRIEINYAN